MKKKKMKKVKISDWMLEKEKPGDAINVLNQSVFNFISLQYWEAGSWVGIRVFKKAVPLVRETEDS